MSRIAPFSPAALADAAAHIHDGRPVAMPTETVYGLAADATDAAAVARIFAAKGRPSFNPLIVHVADLAMARRYAGLDALAERLAAAFWPGPLTLVLPLRPDSGLAPAVTAGLDSVAVRVPAHAAMQALIAATGKPLAAPSANASGRVSPTSAAHVEASLGDRVPLIIDGGETERGLESTIIAPRGDHIVLLRPGVVTAEALTAAVNVRVRDDDSGTIRAPGQLASHYAPTKPIRLNVTAPDADEFLIGFGPMRSDYPLSDTGDLAAAAQRLFAALHRADASTCPRIAVAPIPAIGIGIAINDRLARAAA